MLSLRINNPHIRDRADLALNIIKTAGKIIKEDFFLDKKMVFRKEPAVNISCDADFKSGEIMINEIEHCFPYDNIISEESKPIEKGGEFLWAIDPLDGTSNFSMSIPYFGICLSIQHNGETKFACILNPINNDLAFAIDNEGAFFNNTPVNIEDEKKTDNMVGFYIQGYGVSKSQEIENLKALILSSKRVLNTWAPSIDWLALLKGHADYIVTYKTETEDFLPGAFIYQQAGGVIETWNGMPVRLDLNKNKHRTVTAVAAPKKIIDQIKSMVSQIKFMS